jgi:hypothetical protein
LRLDHTHAVALNCFSVVHSHSINHCQARLSGC